MSMRCKVNNRITLLNVYSTTLEEEDMEVEEDTKVMEDIEAEDEDQSSVRTTDTRVTSYETVRRSHVPIVKLPIMLLKSA